MIEVDIKIAETAYCTRYGHNAEDCYIKKKADESRKKREECEEQSNVNVAKAIIAQSDSQDPVHSSYSRATLCKADAKSWYMDSGASDHMCGDKKETTKRDGRCIKCGRGGHDSGDCKTGWKATTPPPRSISFKSTSKTNTGSGSTSSALVPTKKQKTETGFLRITELGEEDKDNTKDNNQDSEESKNE